MCSSPGGRAAAEAVVAEAEVVGIIGTLCSGAAVAAVPVLSAAGLSMVSSANTSPVGTAIARGADRFVYGDNWLHDMIVEDVRNGEPDTEYPTFVDGARRCPLEDVGGPDGFMDFLEAVLFDPADEKCRDMVRWYGGPFDPIGFEEAMARFGMENMAQRRRGPLASHRSGSRRAKR